MGQVVVSDSFDDLRSRHVRLLHEASRLGTVRALLWSDETLHSLTGRETRFPLAERLYLLQAVRYVSQVTVLTGPAESDALPVLEGLRADIWAVDEAHDSAQKRAYCATHGLEYHVFMAQDLQGFPIDVPASPVEQPPRRRVMVTGCYDWLHSGHIRFFEEASALGDLYVVVGSDANVRLLKGEGHPLFSQDERRYMAQSVRYVKGAMISTGHGWMDAEPEVALVKPHIYVVNEDGDKPEKRAFCQAHGIEYVVLKRSPKEGLPKRQSTVLRGF
jgi:cytidyltransferase-like protein